MRKITNMALSGGFAALILVLPSCIKSDDPFSEIDLIPVKTTEDGKWSMINDKGEIVYDAEFKNAPSASVNGVFCVEEKEGIALYKAGGKEPELIKGCDKLKDAGVYREGLIPVAFPKSRITLIDNNGVKKAELMPVSGHEIVESGSAFSEGLLTVRTDDDKRGYVDKSGKVVIEPKYDFAADFSEGLAIVARNDSQKNDSIEIDDDIKMKYTVIDKKGNKQFDLKDDMEPQTYLFKYGRLFVKKGENQIGYLDTKGEYHKLPAKVKNIVNYDDKYFAYMDDNDQYGVMDFEGESIVRAKYDGIYIMGKYFAARQDDKWRVLDEKGDDVEGFDKYDDIAYFGRFGYLVNEGGKTKTLIDDKGKAKGKEEFYEFGGRWNYSVESDYFDVTGVANTIVEMVTEQGIGKYRLGGAPGSMLGGKPEDHLYTSQVTLEELAKSGLGYSITFQALFTANVADYDYDYNFDRVTYWNTSSKLAMIGMTLTTEKVFGLDGYNALLKGFKDKGFKEVKSSSTEKDKFASLLRKGNTLLLISGGKKETGAEIGVIDGTVPGIEESMKMSVDSLSNDSSDDSTPVEEMADSVVVEEVAADTVW